MLEQIVKSKYFHKSGMDESSTDFQEKKNICTGPKTIKKSNVKRQRPKKRIKGQKDIRTLINPKKNELFTFTKDFNDVCVKGGIDVDSQQLQLAIALSKSLQQSEQVEGGDFSCNKSLSLQERTNRIRRTLQEYGFKVPDTKIRLDSYKRVKKYRKPYKLLQISNEEKQQKICNRYSQVLFENPDKSFETVVNDYNTDSNLYNLATNATYELLKSNEVFYITNILNEISISKGNLLRDWSDIPGRPVSPKLVEEFVISISEIQCSQSELDIILSGTLKTVKDIFKSKLNNNSYCETKFQENSFNNPEINIVNIENSPAHPSNQSILINQSLNRELKSDKGNLSIKSLPQHRSNSPDIFDDEVSLINNSVNKSHQNVEDANTSKFVGPNISILDLTEPTEATNDVSTLNPCSQPSCDRTKRKSNDFMDLTECVPITSHCRTKLLAPLNKIDDELIHNDNMEFTKCVNLISQESCAINYDHMQNGDKVEITNESLTDEYDKMKLKNNVNSHDLPTVEISNEEERILEECSSEDTIIINDNYIDLTQNCHNNSVIVENSLKTGESVEMMDLTQSSNSDDDLPAVHIPGTQKSLDDTIIVNNDENSVLTQTNINKGTISPKLNKKEITDFHEIGNVTTIEINEDTVLGVSDDLFPSHNINVEKGSNTFQGSYSKTQYEASMQENQSINLEYASNVDMENENIDLTQSSDSTIEDYQGYPQNGNIIENLQFNDYNSLGKIADISIDYDEIASDRENASKRNETYQNVQNKCSNTPSSNDAMKSLSKDINSDNFELSDKELNYSLSKSNIDNIDFDGISILNDIPNKSNNKTFNCNHTINRSLSESDLAVNGNNIENINYREKHFNVTLSKSTCSTPIKAVITDDKVSIKTPTNSEYVIKTDAVTPMLDYAAMSSPERSKELEKYGLKPFKRKRAIQLLTHLYNQTHPIIEQCSEDPVPLKKFKPNFTKNTPEKDTITNLESDKENNIYTESTDVPVIRDIHCGADDWVFQKREKAKVHSCPVPLHVAFHNYVSCRRRLREAILRYEPINIDVLHKDLVSYGYKYNPKDLLKFLDRKCITVKTADNNARNNK